MIILEPLASLHSFWMGTEPDRQILLSDKSNLLNINYLDS